MFMRQINQLPQLGFRKQGKGTAGEFEAVDVVAHRLENILQIPLAHGRVVGPPDLGHADLSRLGRAGVMADEAKGVFVLEHDFRLIGGGFAEGLRRGAEGAQEHAGPVGGTDGGCCWPD